jgi:hypothetical protein
MSHVILCLSILTYCLLQVQLASGICDWTYCLAQVCPLTPGVDQGACLCSVNATEALSACLDQETCTNEEGDDQAYYAGACCSNFHLSKLY